MNNRTTKEDLIKKGLVEVSPGVWAKPLRQIIEDVLVSEESVTHFVENTARVAMKSGATFIFYVTPMGKPSYQKSDAFRVPGHKNLRYRQRNVVTKWIAFKKELSGQAQSHGFVMPESGATIIFHIPMPHSWNLKKQQEMNGKPHQQKPDLDNMLKAFFDSVCPEDDSYIWEYLPAKRWALTGSIEVTIK